MFFKKHTVQDRLAKMITDIQKGSVDVKEPLPSLLAAAEEGDPCAQYDLANRYVYGIGGVKQDLTTAFMWFEKAALQNLPEAQFQVGLAYKKGSGISLDHKLAFYWFERAANHGLSIAQYHLSTLYAEGMGVQKNLKRSFDLLKAAAEEKGLAVAQFVLGKLYYNGRKSCPKQDTVSALFWIEQAAQQGFSSAESLLAFLCFVGNEDKGIKKDSGKALFWAEKAALHNVAEAQALMGVMYEEGIGVEKDLALAYAWYKKAAEQNDTTAQCSLGTFYYHGRWKIGQDYRRAFSLFEAAAHQGHIDSMLYVGIMYFHGRGVVQDFDQSREWQKKAEEAGFSGAKLCVETMEMACFDDAA